MEGKAGRRQRGERLREAHGLRGGRGDRGRRDERVPAALAACRRGRGGVRVREREERRHELQKLEGFDVCAKSMLYIAQAHTIRIISNLD